MSRLPSSGDDPIRTRAIIAGIAFGVIFGVLGVGIASLQEIHGIRLALVVFGMGLGAGVAMFFISNGIAEGSARAVSAFVHPTGASTPYEEVFSAHDALEAKGDVQGAIEAYESTLRTQPDNPRALRQAAELYVRANNAPRAAELFGVLRRASTAGADELYATQRLADLYLGSLGDDGKALVELRRIVERFPGTPESEGARIAIRRLKEERGRGNAAH